MRDDSPAVYGANLEEFVRGGEGGEGKQISGASTYTAQTSYICNFVRSTAINDRSLPLTTESYQNN